MAPKELSDFDLNQLVLLQELMVERSESKVADNLGLTRAAAAELGPQQIRVNAICPVSIQTEGVKLIVDAAMAAKCVARTPLGRLGQVEAAADVALFLASDDSRWVTGELLLVDGGATHAVL